MPVTYVGSGTAYVSVGPSSPIPSAMSGTVAGDLLFTVAAVRNGTMSASAAWTHFGTFAGQGGNIAIWYRWATNSDPVGPPIIDFNCGATDTTIAQVFAFRGVYQSSPFHSMLMAPSGHALPAATFPSTIVTDFYDGVDYATADQSSASGSYYFLPWVANNDVSATFARNLIGDWTGITVPAVESIVNASTLGDDMTLGFVGVQVPSRLYKGGTDHYMQLSVSSSGAANVTPAYVRLRSIPAPQLYTGTGGAKVGGYANSEIVASNSPAVPVSYIGAGTYSAGNNAAVTPGIPSGLQAGDLMVAICSIKSATGVVATPSGWNAGPSGGVSTIAAKWRFWQAGDTAPTITFTGGASNTTTQAIILAFRGVHPTSPMYTTAELAINPNPTDSLSGVTTGFYWEGSRGQSGNLVIGDFAVGVRTFGNDVANPGATWIGASDTGTLWNNSTLGSDATLVIDYGRCTGFPCETTLLPDSTIGAVLHAFAIRQKPAIFYARSSGGVKVGGTAAIEADVGFYGTGGAKVGGAANTFKYTTSMAGSGGIKIDGYAICVWARVPLEVAGTGGIKASGAATTRAALAVEPGETYYRGLEMVFSGGNSNTFAVTSLGGLPSLAAGGAVSGQMVSFSLPGVEFRFSNGLPVGVGSIRYRTGYHVITFIDPNGTEATTAVGGDGYYVLGSLVVKITTSQLPTQTTTSEVFISAPFGNILDNVEYSNRLAGEIDYRCLYVANRAPVPLTCVLTVLTDPTYADILVGTEAGLSIGTTLNDLEAAGAWWYGGPTIRASLDVTAGEPGIFYPLGVFSPVLGIYTPPQSCYGTSSGAVQIPDEHTPHPLFGYLTWGTTLNFGTIQPGEYRSFWVKRTVPIDSGLGLLDDLALIKISYGD